MRLQNILPTWNAKRFHRVGGHHADFGVGSGGGTANRISIELHELAVAARAWLFVAEDPALPVAAKGRWQELLVLGDVAGKGGG